MFYTVWQEITNKTSVWCQLHRICLFYFYSNDICLYLRHVSGITLIRHVSGITLIRHVSGITLIRHVSGITLIKHVSGITLIRHVSGITLIRHVHSQTIGKLKNLDLFESK